MAEKNLDDLFHDTLKDIYYAERKILAALPKMAKAAQAPELKAAFEKHRDQTEAQVERLIEVFGIIDKKPQGKTCPAIDGWVTTRLAPRGGPVSWRPAHSSAAGAGRR